MGKGYENNAVQVLEGTLRGDGKGEYDGNVALVLRSREGDESALGELVELNRGLVKSIALRFRDRGVELDDLLQVGTIGLIKAARSFEEERGTCFSTYAFPLILGEIRRHIRDEGPLKIGRYYKKLGVELARERARILAEEGREPKVSELAMRLSIPPEEAAIALEAMSPMASLSDSAFGEDEGSELGDLIADSDSLREQERFIDRLELARAMRGMSDMWKKIVLLRFYRGKTQQQIADSLGLSQVKVSREEKKIIEYLRGQLDP